MSHNPNTVKSQDDTTEDELGRTMTLLRVIEQLEKTECELERAEHKAERLQKQLDIAVWALYSLLSGKKTIKIGKSEELIETYALNKIEELDK